VLVTGTVADRVDRRRLAAIALTAEAVAVAALAFYVSTDPTSTLPIFLLVIAYGTGRAFATPATRSLPADSMEPERLPWLTARQSATWQGATIVGPVLGGFLYVVDVWVPSSRRRFSWSAPRSRLPGYGPCPGRVRRRSARARRCARPWRV
jgi:MFS family permease